MTCILQDRLYYTFPLSFTLSPRPSFSPPSSLFLCLSCLSSQHPSNITNASAIRSLRACNRRRMYIYTNICMCTCILACTSCTDLGYRMAVCWCRRRMRLGDVGGRHVGYSSNHHEATLGGTQPLDFRGTSRGVKRWRMERMAACCG